MVRKSISWFISYKGNKIDTLICTTDEYGITRYKLNGELHRDDGPAVIEPNGYQAWYQSNRVHRIDGPARIYSDGVQEWYSHGALHRTDGPAVRWADGQEEYWLNGEEVDIMVHFLQRK